jgi:site-specific DNA-methyltransferase (adenine-specific)
MKPETCFYVWGTTKTDTFLKYKLNTLNEIPGAVYQNWIIWAYDWGGRTKKKFPRKHEDILMYSKGKEFPFYSDDIRVPYKMAKNVRSGASNNPLGKIPTDVWTKNNHTTSKEYAGWHSTQKPIALLERIIKAHTKPGDVVVDCFSGAGSTMIACNNLGRDFRGCEFDKEYVDKSLERLEKLSAIEGEIFYV